MIKETTAIVGGIYREHCMRPAWREIFGSAVDDDHFCLADVVFGKLLFVYHGKFQTGITEGALGLIVSVGDDQQVFTTHGAKPEEKFRVCLKIIIADLK